MTELLYYKTGFELELERELLNRWGFGGDVRLHEVSRSSGETLAESAGRVGAEGVLIVFEEVSEQTLRAAPSIKAVSIPSIGYNNIDIEAAKALGICVTNVTGYCVEEVATHTLALALDLARKLSFLDADVKRGNWNIGHAYPCHRLSGASFGLVFFGEIPKKMTSLLKALGMEILVYAPTKSTEYLAEFGCRKIETLDELLKQADFVSVHTPLLPETEGLFDEREFSLMKSSAFFINTSRGKVVREEALYDALKNRRIRAAAVDVIENELEGQTKLRELDNVIITPHSAFLSDESLLESRERALRHLVDYLVCHRQPENRIV